MAILSVARFTNPIVDLRFVFGLGAVTNIILTAFTGDLALSLDNNVLS